MTDGRVVTWPVEFTDDNAPPPDARPGCTDDHPQAAPHPCPYKQDVDGDGDTLCNCCAPCTRVCAREI